MQIYYKGSGNGIDCGRGTHDPDEENLVCVTNTSVLNMFVGNILIAGLLPKG